MRQQALRIFQRQADAYRSTAESRYFPNLNVIDLVNRCFAVAYAHNISAAIRELRQWLLDSANKDNGSWLLRGGQYGLS